MPASVESTDSGEKGGADQGIEQASAVSRCKSPFEQRLSPASSAVSPSHADGPKSFGGASASPPQSLAPTPSAATINQRHAPSGARHSKAGGAWRLTSQDDEEGTLTLRIARVSHGR